MTETVEKMAAFVLASEEMLADARGFLDMFLAAQAASEAAQGERYRGVYARGYQTGAQAAFDALLSWIDRGGRIGLPMSKDSLHTIGPEGMSAEVMSLLALRPWGSR